ncbi:unnamed protein product [Acanthoscelides obtectus]|uniref:Serpin domain-containing protein n=1 Tax=Acanthoscelides obtectus TaxID=200917 RepID=A0A9P0KTW1_ACAOB|nr:unnamed protein product [Acanthoscelides obtectus]CAK1655109.1 Serpin B8 [Acanthoscelides obtectus]
MRRILIFLIMGILFSPLAVECNETTTDGEESRKILGSSVVTSVSVIMDTGNGTKVALTDAVGNPIGKPSQASDVGSPINLLNPDRYEFYTFDDNGELIKRLMSLEEIKGIIATGDTDDLDLDAFTSQGYLPEKKVNDVVNNVQNVLKEEMETHKNTALDIAKPLYDTPDVSDSWSMILPAVFGNSGESIKPEKPITHVTPDTIMLDPTHHYLTSTKTQTPATIVPKPIVRPTVASGSDSFATTYRPTSYIQLAHKTPSTSTTKRYVQISTTPRPSTTTKAPVPLYTSNQINYTLKPVQSPNQQTPGDDLKNMPNVEIFTNSHTSTESPKVSSATSNPPTTLFVRYTSQPSMNPISNNIFWSSSNTELRTSPSSSTAYITEVTASTTTSTPKPQPSSFKVSSSSVSTQYTSAPTSAQTTFKANSVGSSTESIATTKETIKPLTKPPQEGAFSTWRPNIPTKTEREPTTTEGTLSTWILPEQGTEMSVTDFAQKLEELFSQKRPSSSTTQSLYSILPERGTTVYQDDTRTTNAAAQSTFRIPESNTHQNSTSPSLQESLSTIQQTVASEMLDQLLLTTNIYEINTELTQGLPTIEEKYITSTEEESRITDTKVDAPTTESFKQEQTTTDKTLIDSIEQLLSQAVGNVGEVLVAVNDTDKIKDLLDVTDTKDMVEVQKESATLASDMVDHSTTTDDITAATYQESNILSESVGSLLSQVYGATTLKIDMNKGYYPTTVIYRKEDGESVKDITTTEIISSVKEETENLTTYIDQNTQSVRNNELSTTENAFITETTVYGKGSSKPSVTERVPSEEVKKTTPSNVPQSIEIYVEKVFNASDKVNVSTTTDKNHHEVLKAEETETVVGKIGSAQWNLLNNSDGNKFNISENTDEISSTTPGSKYREPTTIVIIKKTNRPQNVATTLNDELTTVNYEKVATTEVFSNTVVSNVSDLPDQPSVDVFINENTVTTTDISEDSVTENFEMENSTLSEDTATSTNDTNIMNEQTSAENKSKVNGSSSQNDHNSWQLVSTIAPHSNSSTPQSVPPPIHSYADIINPPSHIDLEAKPMQGFGLEESTSTLDADIFQFTQLCNELAFGFWKSVTKGVSSARSVFISPFGATSLLAMVFLGARGSTSGEMNEILKLDDMVTFNPHLIFKNVSDSIKAHGAESGVAVSAIVRELFSDRGKGKLLHFYKERAKAFYDGFVEEVSFKEIGDVIRRRTNLQVKKHSNGRITEFLKDSSIMPKPPLVAMSVNIFQTDCSSALPPLTARDSELHFSVSPSVRQRRLVPVPAVVFDSSKFLAGYEPSLDATAAAVGSRKDVISAIYVIPGSPGQDVPGDGLGRLEKRIVESSFKKAYLYQICNGRRVLVHDSIEDPPESQFGFCP